MPSSKGGRTLQECYDSLGTLVKRKRGENEPLNAKRQCIILQEQLPLIMLQRRDTNNNSTDDNATNETKQDTESKSSNDLTREYIQEQRKLVEQDAQRLEDKRRAFFQKHSDFVGVYMHGLETISKLTDLRDAPDAILPGNQA